MKKFIVCALFAWWFVAIGYGGYSRTTTFDTIGPFATKAQCEAVKKKTDDVHFYGAEIQTVGCWDDGTGR